MAPMVTFSHILGEAKIKSQSIGVINFFGYLLRNFSNVRGMNLRGFGVMVHTTIHGLLA